MKLDIYSFNIENIDSVNETDTLLTAFNKQPRQISVLIYKIRKYIENEKKMFLLFI